MFVFQTVVVVFTVIVLFANLFAVRYLLRQNNALRLANQKWDELEGQYYLVEKPEKTK